MNSREVMTEITKRKEIGVKAASNFFPSAAMEQIEFQTLLGKKTVVFWGNDSTATRVYFHSSDAKELTQLLQEVPSNTVLDYVCKDGLLPRQEIEAAGYRLYASYCKRQISMDKLDLEPKSRKDRLLYDMYKPDCGDYAVEDDLPLIQELLVRVFEPKVDHLYKEDELKEMIKKKEILLYKVKNHIESLYIYKTEGKCLYSAYSYNNATADILYSLERRAREKAREKGVKFMYAWFNEDNYKALRRTLLQDTGMRDYIFVK